MSHDPELRAVALAGLDDAALARLFTRVYAGYPVPLHLDAEAMRTMVAWNDLDRDASRMLLERGAPVALAMLGRRGTRGWIGGMGVVPEARRKGHGRAVMRAVLASAHACGVREVDLEVLTRNRGATAIYGSLGFRRVRDLEVWRIRPGSEPGVVAVGPMEIGAARDWIRRARRAPEPWQRDDATVDRLLAQRLAIEPWAAREDERITGVVLCRASGARVSVVQMAVAPGRERTVVPALLATIARPEASEGVRWLNLPADDPIAAAVRTLDAECEARQHEMRLVIP